MESVSKKEKAKQRPQALNTVEMLRVASSALGMCLTVSPPAISVQLSSVYLGLQYSAALVQSHIQRVQATAINCA